jgi:hypothetical protein
MAAQRSMTGSTANAGTRRLSAAFGLWLVGFFPPLLIPVVTASALSPLTKGVVAGLLVFGLPQLFTALALVLVGRKGMQQLLSQVRSSTRRWLERLSQNPVSLRPGELS